MEDLSGKAVFKLCIDNLRGGELTGLFIATPLEVKTLIDHKIGVYFGEVLGKNSEIVGIIEEKEIQTASKLQSVVETVEKHNLSTGYNPFEQYVSSSETESMRDEWEGNTVLEVVHILIYEMDEPKFFN